jgi:hypothetical protein
MKVELEIDDTNKIYVGGEGVRADLNIHGVRANVDVAWVEMQYAYDLVRGAIPSKVMAPGETNANQDNSPVFDLRKAPGSV